MKREQTTKPHELIPIVVCFPAGIKTYVEDPAAILALDLPDCPRCHDNQGHWVIHEWRPRYTEIDGRWLQTLVCRLRCPVCRKTTRLLPDEILPWGQYTLPTIQAGCEAYVETAASYRQAALTVSAGSVPTLESLTTCWGGPAAPELSPSTIFRWVDRFSRGAGAWWMTLAAEAQARSTQALRTPEAPGRQSAKARSDAKAKSLKLAWHLLALLRWLLALPGLGHARWPRLLTFAPKRPPDLDHTGWFVAAPAPP